MSWNRFLCLEVQRQLGKGSFGTVYLVSHRRPVRVCMLGSIWDAKQLFCVAARTQVDQNKEKRDDASL